MNPEFQGRLEVTKMHLLTALDIGKECALATVGESIYNIDLRAGQIFTYSEIGKELKQLYSEWNTIKLNSEFTSDSSLIEVIDWMKNTDVALKDEFGGIHDEGMRWNPNGVFCGECGNITCINCSSKDNVQ